MDPVMERKPAVPVQVIAVFVRQSAVTVLATEQKLVLPVRETAVFARRFAAIILAMGRKPAVAVL